MTEREPPAPSFDIPDLELEPAVSKRPAAARAPAQRDPKAELDFGGGVDDDFELVALGESAALADGHTGVELASGTGRPPERATSAASWPSGRTRAIDQLPIDADEVARVADYGAAPTSALGSPLYAYRVFSRRRPLRLAIEQHYAALTQAEHERDSALMQLAMRLRPTLAAHDVFRRLLQPVQAVEQLAGDRSAALSEADAGYREQMARFDTERQGLEAALSSARSAVAEKQAIATGTEAEQRRALAKEQRIQIEIRGVMDLARQALGPAGGEIPTAQAARLAELQAKLVAFEPELSQAKEAHASASSALGLAEQEELRVADRIKQLERQKSRAAGPLAAQLSVRAAGVSEAEKQRRDTWAEVARGVLAARGSIAVPEATLDALHRLDREVDAAAVRLQTHVRAIDAHDRERARQGVIFVLCVLGLLLVSVLIKAVL